MKKSSWWVLPHFPFLLILLFNLAFFLSFTPSAKSASQGEATPPSEKSSTATSGSQEGEKKEEKKEEFKLFEEVVKEAEKLEGLFTLYRKKEKVYLELRPDQLEKDYLVLITLETGTGSSILAGFPMDTKLCRFHRVYNNLQFIQRNVYFRANPNDPVHRAVQRSFSDSVLASLKIESEHKERKSLLVDLSGLFLIDFADLTNWVNPPGVPGGYNLDRDKSYFGTVKVFPQNIEIESVFVLTNSRPRYDMALPDSRAMTLKVRYSLSELPQNDYVPRLADDRVGYFITAFRDYSQDQKYQNFVRYINRWHLEKENPQAPLSRPKQPIVFWIENTVPVEYREAIKEGVLMWNKAFEKAGFKDAIEVRIQPDNADWDPADVRYSTIRWITSMYGAFAMGPSRVNPLTGQILDADIIVDAGYIRAVKEEYRRFIRHLERSAVEGSPLSEIEGIAPPQGADPQLLARLCMMGPFMAQQTAFGISALFLRGDLRSEEVPKEYIHAMLRELIAHEVGHTLGLRHNFHGSTLLSPRELHNFLITRRKGLSSSVMDYLPVNLAPPGVKQGEFYSSTVGPYDIWAIEYGYTPFGAKTPEEEKPFLEKIASRAPRPELAYGTDEDLWGLYRDLDPLISRFDLSSDPLEWAYQRSSLARDLMKRIEMKIPYMEEGYYDARYLFGITLSEQLNGALIAVRFIGGQYTHRDHPTDPGGRPPFVPVPATQQRKAFDLLQKNLFSEEALRFPPHLLNKLGFERWLHWGIPFEDMVSRPMDYPIHSIILAYQSAVFNRLFSPIVLRRLLDTEVKVVPPEKAFTIPELFGGLRKTLWSEITSPRPNLRINSFRRGLQREYLARMIRLIQNPLPGTPEDARTVAWYELRLLLADINKALKQPLQDTYTLAHLEESRVRIQRALELRLGSS